MTGGVEEFGFDSVDRIGDPGDIRIVFIVEPKKYLEEVRVLAAGGIKIFAKDERRFDCILKAYLLRHCGERTNQHQNCGDEEMHESNQVNRPGFKPASMVAAARRR